MPGMVRVAGGAGWSWGEPGLDAEAEEQDGAGAEPGLKPKFDTAELEKVAEQLDQETLPIYFC